MIATQRNDSSKQRWLGGVAVAAVLLTSAAGAAEKIPQTMRAVEKDHSTYAVRFITAPVPKPEKDQVLLRVYAVSFNPGDWQLYSMRRPGDPPPEPGIFGNDVAGVVVAVGSDVKEFKVGDKVHGGINKAMAEYAVAPASALVLKPKKFTYEQAAGIGLAGRTGLRMVLLGEVKKDERVLIVGAAGGVGATAVQVAHELGAHVVTVASSRHNQYLKSIGADELINYDKQEVVAVAKDFPVVLNMTTTENGNVLKYAAPGALVIQSHGGITGFDWTPKDHQVCAIAGVKCIRVGFDGTNQIGPKPVELLKRLSQMADEGKYSVEVEKSFPFDQTPEALKYANSGNREGKIVIDVNKDATKT